MSEWPMVKLGEVANFVSGGTPNRKIEKFYTGKIPWISGADISNSGNIEIRRRITEEAVNQSATNIVSAGTILLVTRTAVGKVSLAPVDLTFSQDITGIFPDKSKILPQYLEYFIRTTGEKELKRKARGVTIRGVSRGDVTELQILLPPLEEQKRIAEILVGTQNAIKLTRLQLDAIESSMKIELWNHPQELWQTQLSHYIKRISSGKSLKEGDWDDFQNAVLKISAVTTGFFDKTEIKPLPNSYTPQESHRVNIGDILLSRANTTELVGASAIVENIDDNLYLPDKLWKLHLKDHVNTYFFWHLLQTKSVRSSISKASSGSGGSMKNISQKSFLNVTVPMLSSETQDQIGTNIRTQRSLHSLFNQKLTRLQELQH